MAAMVDPELPVDLIGRPLTLDQVKEMICRDVDELRRLHSLKALDDARRVEEQIHIPNRRLANLVEMWERAHDLHWAWYRTMLDAATEGS